MAEHDREASRSAFPSRDSDRASSPATAQTSASEDGGERRRFLGHIAVALAAAVGLATAVPVVGFLFAPARRRRDELWRPVGPVDSFPVGGTVKVTYVNPEPLPWAGFTARSAAWVRREAEDRFIGFSIYCTHTGCPVRWVEGGEMFLCPCHGGAFDRDGSVVGGPPPRPLDRIPVRVRGGQVELLSTGVPTPD